MYRLSKTLIEVCELTPAEAFLVFIVACVKLLKLRVKQFCQ